MSLIRRQDVWNPFRELEDLSNRFNQLLSQPQSREALELSDWAPSCDISETDDKYRIRAELPSVDKEDVSVTLENGVLTIAGERKSSAEDKGEKYHRRELSYGRFVRSFRMPDDADESAVKAKYKDGLLKVDIKKAEQKSPKPKQITVH